MKKKFWTKKNTIHILVFSDEGYCKISSPFNFLLII